MIKKMFFIMSVVNVSIILYSMQTPYKKKEASKSKKSSSKKTSQEWASSSEDTDQSNQNNSVMIISSPKSNTSSSQGGKLSVKSLDDLKDVRKAQNEFREKMYKSDSASGKK